MQPLTWIYQRPANGDEIFADLAVVSTPIIANRVLIYMLRENHLSV